MFLLNCQPGSFVTPSVQPNIFLSPSHALIVQEPDRIVGSVTVGHKLGPSRLVGGWVVAVQVVLQSVMSFVTFHVTAGGQVIFLQGHRCECTLVQLRVHLFNLLILNDELLLLLVIHLPVVKVFLLGGARLRSWSVARLAVDVRGERGTLPFYRR